MITRKKDLTIEDHMHQVDKMYPSRVIRTSGSTSKPLLIALNEYDEKAIIKVGKRCLENAGLRRGLQVFNTMNSSLWAGGSIDSDSIKATGATLFNFSVGNTKELISLIMMYPNPVLHCTPSYLNRIKQVAAEEFGITPKMLGLKLILAGGEAGVDNDDFRSRIENEFGCDLINANYGSADSVSILASEDSRYKNGLTFLGGDEVYATLYSDGKITEINKVGQIGELLVTTKWEYGLINRNNYSIGDIIEITEILGPNKFRFKVLGRSDDMLVIRGLNVYPNNIRSTIERVLTEYEVNPQYQLLISKTDPIEDVVLVLNKEVNEEVLKDLSTELKKTININVDIKYGNIIEGNTGKIKLIQRVL